MANIPVFKATIDNYDEGIFAISLVDEPAVEKDFIAFKKHERPEFKFEIENKKEHCITGVIMLADTPIYRWSEQMGDYYIVFSKDIIKKMAEKMLHDMTFNRIDLQHDENYFYEKCNLVELFIKDSTKGISHTAFTDVPEGSLFATYKVMDIDLWDKIESGEVKGFSLEGLFSFEETFNKQKNKTENKMNKFKQALRNLLQQFGTVTTKDGVEVEYDGDALEVGVAITAEDGEYILDDDTKIEVKDGKIVSIEAPEVEDEEEVEAEEEETTTTTAPEEEVIEEEEEVEETTDEEEVEEPSEIDQIKAMIEGLKQEIESIKDKIAEIATLPAADPIEETFEKANEENVKDKRLNNILKYAKAIKK